MSILDEFPYPLQKPDAQRLMQIMADLFSKQEEAVLFTLPFGVDKRQIKLALAPIELWQELLQQLSNQGAVRRMVESVRNKFPNNPSKAFLDDLLVLPPAPKLIKKAFVIQPIGEGAVRERNDRVFEELIRPACAAAGFDAERVINESNKSITEPIISPLFGHPVAVADLGNLSTVDPNVMIEAGFRLSTGRPILFLADAPLPDVVPSHLPRDRDRILVIDPGDPKARLNELVWQVRARSTRETEQGKEQGWVSEHPWVDWQWSFDSAPVYLNANAKAAALYGLANVNEIIGHEVDEVDGRLFEFMDPNYKEAFVDEQKAIFGRIMASLREREPLTTAATLPLIFCRHPDTDKLKSIHYPLIVNYKVDKENSSVVFRTVFLRIDEWCARDLAERTLSDRKIPSLFRESRHYEFDFFLCYDASDFHQALQLKQLLINSGFSVWWPFQWKLKGSSVPTDKLRTNLAKSRIAAVLIGAGGSGRWGEGELDDALYKHCELRKPLILFLLPDASNLQPEDWLGPRYATLLPDPLYLNWPDEDAVNKLLVPGATPSFLERILAEVVKLLRL